MSTLFSDTIHFHLKNDEVDEIWVVTMDGKRSRIHSFNGYTVGETIKNALLRSGIPFQTVTSLPERQSNE